MRTAARSARGRHGGRSPLRSDHNLKPAESARRTARTCHGATRRRHTLTHDTHAFSDSHSTFTRQRRSTYTYHFQSQARRHAYLEILVLYSIDSRETPPRAGRRVHAPAVRVTRHRQPADRPPTSVQRCTPRCAGQARSRTIIRAPVRSRCRVAVTPRVAGRAQAWRPHIGHRSSLIGPPVPVQLYIRIRACCSRSVIIHRPRGRRMDVRTPGSRALQHPSALAIIACTMGRV